MSSIEAIAGVTKSLDYSPCINSNNLHPGSYHMVAFEAVRQLFSSALNLKP